MEIVWAGNLLAGSRTPSTLKLIIAKSPPIISACKIKLVVPQSWIIRIHWNGIEWKYFFI